jgi:hypothetical protein
LCKPDDFLFIQFDQRRLYADRLEFLPHAVEELWAAVLKNPPVVAAAPHHHSVRDREHRGSLSKHDRVPVWHDNCGASQVAAVPRQA